MKKELFISAHLYTNLNGNSKVELTEKTEQKLTELITLLEQHGFAIDVSEVSTQYY